ncbi:MAG: periplasmic heavy metal sensor [Alphaproteobacteria bacterium]|nr:MAG: periplasmic heavy metal sensor [Alphaproteobacteria bacterium]
MNGSRKWLVAALVASIILNIFFAAFLVGRSVWHDGGRHRHAHHGETLTMRLELKALGATLSGEARRALGDSMRARRDEVLPRIAAIHEARREIIRLLSAPELDEAALRAAFDRLAEGLVALQRPLEETILEAATRMTPEERRRMAQKLAELQARSEWRSGHSRQDGEGEAKETPPARPDGAP